MKAMLVACGAWIASATLTLASAPGWRADATIHLDVGSRYRVADVDVSSDGRFVAFVSRSPLLPNAGTGLEQVYVLDRTSGRMTLESLSTYGSAANGTSEHPRLSGDGRYVTFASAATNLVEPGATLGALNVFLRDRLTHTTTVISGGPQGGPVETASQNPDISDDGTVGVFESTFTGLVPGRDPNRQLWDVYLYDIQRRRTERVSVDREGRASTAGASGYPSVSGNGRYVAFTSSESLTGEPAPTMAGAQYDPLTARRVFLRDRVRGSTTLVSRTPDGRAPNGSSFRPTISGDGRRVAFVSRATDLGPPDRNRAADVYAYETMTERTTLVSRGARGGSGDGRSFDPVISTDSRYVVFVSEASDLACGRGCPSHIADVNLVSDIYRFDMESQTVERVSGAEANRPQWWEASHGPAVDGAGRVIAFSSLHPRDASDLEHDFDLFIFVKGLP